MRENLESINTLDGTKKQTQSFPSDYLSKNIRKNVFLEQAKKETFKGMHSSNCYLTAKVQ